MKRLVAVVATFLFASLASAQSIVCVSASGGNWIYTSKFDRCTERSRPGGREELRMFGFPCDKVSGLPHCNPPAKMTYAVSPPPFNVPVKFDGEYTDKGFRMWRWRSVATGNVLYVSPRFWLAVPQ